MAYRADGPGPGATSGQGRAYSAARGDRDSPDRPAPSANNSPARCAISRTRRRDLTLHSKIAGPSKCSYRLKCSRRPGFPACGARKHYTGTSNNRLAEIRFPCVKSLSIDLRQMSHQLAPWTARSSLQTATRVRFGCAAMLLSMRPFNSNYRRAILNK